MKTVLALIFVFSAFTAFAGEVDSNCAQINDSVDREARETTGSGESDNAVGGVTNI
jgi:hypothetical protein